MPHHKAQSEAQDGFSSVQFNLFDIIELHTDIQILTCTCTTSMKILLERK